MIKNTLHLVVLIVPYLLGLVFALILMYSSPDNIPHLFEASLFIFASSVVILVKIYHFSYHHERSPLMRFLYIFLLIKYILSSITLAMICNYAIPLGATVDMTALSIFMLSALLLIMSLFLTIIKTKGIAHA